MIYFRNVATRQVFFRVALFCAFATVFVSLVIVSSLARIEGGRLNVPLKVSGQRKPCFFRGGSKALATYGGILESMGFHVATATAIRRSLSAPSRYWYLMLFNSSGEDTARIKSSGIDTGFADLLGNILENSTELCNLLQATLGFKSCSVNPQKQEDFADLTPSNQLDGLWAVYFFNGTTPTRHVHSTADVLRELRFTRLHPNSSIVVFPLAGNSETVRLFFLVLQSNPLRVDVFYDGILTSHGPEVSKVLLLKFYSIPKARTLRCSALALIRRFLNIVKLNTQSGNRDSEFGFVFAADFSIGEAECLNLELITTDIIEQGSIIDGVALMFVKAIIADIESQKWDSCTNQWIDPDDTKDLNLGISMTFSPTLHLEPSYRQDWTNYSTTVPYETILVHINPAGQSFHFVLDNELNVTREGINVSIGLGRNDFVVSARHLATNFEINYRFSIFRKHRLGEDTGNQSSCYFYQECGLRFTETKPCGLQTAATRNWNQLMQQHMLLPLCTEGHSKGRWYVPCRDCSDESSCAWNKSHWLPDSCRYEIRNSGLIQRCLSNKTLIFLGDSTNRAIMNELVQRVDGSLAFHDKSHAFRALPGVNGGATRIFYDYYPKFWAEPSERPSFGRILMDLLQRSGPEEDVILVVGGLNWLGLEQLGTIRRTLDDLRATNIRVFIKTPGAGFVLPVTGIRHMEHDRILSIGKKMQSIIRVSTSYGFHVIDTWNMTVARYRDFYPGKCHCHFHQIEQEAEPPSSGPIRKQRPKFRISGPINSIYADILLHLIC